MSNETTYISSVKLIDTEHAIVFKADGASIFADKPIADPKKIKVGPKESKRGFVVWGDTNKLPFEVMDKINKSGVVSANVGFLRDLVIGEGIVQPVKIIKDGSKRVVEPYDDEAVNDWFNNNDILSYLTQGASDLMCLNWPIPEMVFNKDLDGKRIVVQLHALQACFSRLEEMDGATGNIDNIFYSAQWADKDVPDPDKVKTVRLLPTFNTINMALGLTGKAPNPSTGKTKDEKISSLAMLLRMPAPGKVYYPAPLWWSVFTSGWYDYNQSLIDYKKALVNKQLSIKYHIEFSDEYFTRIFESENITTKEAKAARVNKEYDDIAKNLQGKDNAGGTLFSYFKYHQTGNMLSMVKITVISNPNQQGEYIEELENSVNLINYIMRVHGSLISSLGGNKTITGTEARELFTMAQALMAPYRRILLRPFYVIKALNGWPKDMDFVIPNQELTRTDENSGAQRVTSQPALL